MSPSQQFSSNPRPFFVISTSNPSISQAIIYFTLLSLSFASLSLSLSLKIKNTEHKKKKKKKKQSRSCSSMGFPVAYSTELFLPKLLLHALSVLGFLRKLVYVLFRFVGLADFLEPDITWSDHPDAAAREPDSRSVSAVLIREILPVVKFSDLVEPPESCAVCLYEFEAEDEIRPLANCRHIFHRSCLDRWMGYEQKTCPLCRTPFIPDDLQEQFHERLWAASGIPEIYGDFSQVSGL